MKQLAALTLLFGLPLSAHADFFEGDWQTIGDNALFIDENNQQVFLKLNYSKYNSYNDLQARFETDLSGWTFASPEQMDNLFFSITGQLSSGHYNENTHLDPYTNINQMMGVTKKSSYQTWSNGYFVENGELMRFQVSEYTQKEGGWVAHRFSHGDIALRQEYKVSDYGFWLTPEQNNLTLFQQNNVEYNTISDVYTPGAISALSLLALGMTRRKRKITTTSR